jgi:hypothetical protein
MSSEKVLVSNTGRFGVRRIPSRTSRSPCTSNWRQTSTTRSESRSRTPSHKTKTIQKLNKAQIMKNKSKLLRIKRKTTVKRPSAPHNTTQYLIDVNNSCQETTNLYVDQDRFTFDFQHHSMAGSMMESFLSRFSKSKVDPAKEQASHPSADPVGNGRPEGMTCREAEIQQPKMETSPEIIRMTLT